MEEQREQQTTTAELIKDLAEIPEKLNEASYLCAAFYPWRKKE